MKVWGSSNSFDSPVGAGEDAAIDPLDNGRVRVNISALLDVWCGPKSKDEQTLGLDLGL